ncbi:MAG: energy transducer TonB [Blastocatellia bacterium]
MRSFIIVIARYGLSTFFAVFIAVNVHGQSTEPSRVPFLSFAKEEFTVLPVCDFTELSKKYDWSIYKCTDNNDWFLITSVSSYEPNQMAEIFDQAATVVERETKKVGGFEAMFLSFGDVDGNFQKVLHLKTNSRTYIFHTASQSNNSTKVNDFFESIKLVTLSQLRSKAKSEKSVSDKLRDPRNISEYVTAQNAGSWKRRYPTANEGAKVGQESNYKMLTKPKPGFSRLARLYEIEGMVRTKVVLLASGTIGKVSISDTTPRLPFGLTSNAIAAAKVIEFRPKIFKGLPVSIIVTIEYNFIIY